MKKNLLNALFLIFITSTAYPFIPNTTFSFDSLGSDDCHFVDNQEIVSALRASLSVLKKIELEREQCRTLHVNSKALLDSYIQFTLHRDSQKIHLREKEKLVRSEIERIFQRSQVYDASLENVLLQILKDKSEYVEKDITRNYSLIQSFKLASTLFQDFEARPECAEDLSSHVVGPSLGLLGTLSGAISPTTSLGLSVIGSFAQMLSHLVSYVESKNSASASSLRELTNSYNYYLSYKCAFKSIDKLTCSMEEVEYFTKSINLDGILKQIQLADPDQAFKKTRDLKRHSERLLVIISHLNKIFNSPETYNALEQVVGFQSGLGKLSIEPKNPPLRNKYYLEALEANNIPHERNVPSWKSWDHNQIAWSLWVQRYFVGGGWLGQRVKSYCRENTPEWYNNATSSCFATGLQKVSNIDKFIKRVIVPSLIDIHFEVKRLNDQIKSFASIQALYAQIQSQEVYTEGHIDFREYSLSKLLEAFLQHTENYKNTPVKFFAKDVSTVIQALIGLVDVQNKIQHRLLFRAHNLNSAHSLNGDEDTEVAPPPKNGEGADEGSVAEKPRDPEQAEFNSFLEAARVAYDTIAVISNNGRQGGILYESVISAKFRNYFDEIQKFFLWGDKERGLRYSRFDSLANFYNKYQEEMLAVSSRGSSNLPLVRDIKNAFLKVFLRPIRQQIRKSQSRYFVHKLKDERRELIHSCALFYPYLMRGAGSGDQNRGIVFHNLDDTDEEHGLQEDSWEKDSWESDGFGSKSKQYKLSSEQRACKLLLKATKGLPFLKGDTVMYSLKPKGKPSYKEACYYYYYEIESMIQKSYRALERSNRPRF